MTTSKNYLHDLGNGIFLMDGKRYRISDNDSSLSDWTCPYCGYSKLIYDLKMAKSEHYAKCKKYKKLKKNKNGIS